MKQHPFEWVEEPQNDERLEIELTPAAAEAAVALMAGMLIQLVRPSTEVSDER